MATPQEIRLVHRTVAATLRQIAGWGSSGPQNAEEWYELAQSVLDDMTCDWPGCVMCEEATCDDDCPLFGYKMEDSDDETVTSVQD